MFVYFVRPSLVIGCLPCICKAGLRPTFFCNESCFRCLCTSSCKAGHRPAVFYNESGFWCLCNSSCDLLSLGACLVFVKLASGQFFYNESCFWLVIRCLPCICKAGLRPAFFYNGSCFWSSCTSSGNLLSLGACLVFVKLALGQLSFIVNHVPGVCVLRLAISCHCVLALYL